MKYLILIRWPNLIIIMLAMVITRYKMIIPSLDQAGMVISSTHLMFVLLMAAVLLIAIGGYVVNDIFDIEKDKVNKPDKQVIGRTISVRTAWYLYRVSTLGGIAIGLWLGWQSSLQLAILIFLVAGLLWFYAQRYKCKPLIGNLLVAVLSSLVIVIVWLQEFFLLRQDPYVFTAAIGVMPMITGLVIAFALFALFTNLIREIVKDIEDAEGDHSQHCRTLPIVLGIVQTKNIAVTLCVVLFAMTGFWLYILFHSQMKAASLALIPALATIVITIVRLALAKKKTHFSQSSVLLKIVMILGIFSMLFLP
ncbi:MAG: geranylgeranylglycerol-phosphate geranylgeranyltransferase [Bacteroidales bacterium]|nr:geranylgeranylglycerol-phosphate geranylgeranyltransferase [Bacteroidales bacterium]